MEKYISFTFFFIIFIFYSRAAEGVFDKFQLNDVSVLYPLPLNLEKDYLLKVNSEKNKGPLIPNRFLEELPPLLFNPRSNLDLVSSLRVISLRIDPCFPGGPTPEKCQKQIRLVWQPLIVSHKNIIEALDAAFHSFYEIDDKSWKKLLTDLIILKKKYNYDSTNKVLSVHEGFINQESYLKDFNSVILTYIGESNLIKITEMVLRGSNDMWGFQSYHVTSEDKNGIELKIETIPRTQNQVSQVFINSASPPNNFDGANVMPVPLGDIDTFNSIIMGALTVPEDDVIMKKEVESIFRIQNPRLHNPDTMDCVSCHVAQSAQLWSLNERSDLKFTEIFKEIIYKNSNHNLMNISKTSGNTRLLRAFGYDQFEPAISQRVINESAEVADWINKELKLSK